jgi:hypothetical protein
MYEKEKNDPITKQKYQTNGILQYTVCKNFINKLGCNIEVNDSVWFPNLV